MKRIILILKNDIKRRLKSPLSILILLIIPVMMTGIIGAVFSPSENKMPKIRVLITDKDKELGAKVFIEAFNSPQVNMFQLELVEEDKGRELISNNKGSALIIIPSGFSKNLLKENKTNLLLIKNPSEQFMPNIVEEFSKTLSILLSGAIQVFDIDKAMINSIKGTNMDYKSLITMLPMLKKNKTNTEKFKKLMTYLNPPLLEIKKEITGKKAKNTGINIFSYILPGISIMFLLFIIEIFIRDILSEREDGKLQRMMFAPLRAGEYITARILSGWIMGILTYLIIVLMGKLIFNIDWGNYLFLFILITITCFWIASFFALLNAFFKNRNQAGAFVAPIIMVFSAFGGSIIQTNQLPEAVRWVSSLTLNHWFIIGANKIRSNVFPTTPILILLISGVILYILASKSLRNRIII